MSDAPVVAVAYAFYDLFKDTFGFLFVKSSILLGLQVAMQATPSNVLHDQDYVL